MFKYAVAEIASRQYLIYPDKEIVVEGLKNTDKLQSTKLLMVVSDKGIEVGTPYLKKTLDFEVLRKVSKKIRVAKFHAKANYRRVSGNKLTKYIIKLSTD